MEDIANEGRNRPLKWQEFEAGGGTTRSCLALSTPFSEILAEILKKDRAESEPQLQGDGRQEISPFWTLLTHGCDK